LSNLIRDCVTLIVNLAQSMLPCLILAFFVLPACSFRLVKQKGRSEIELDAGAVDELAVSTSEAMFFTAKKGTLFCGNGQLTWLECLGAASQLGNDFRGEMNDRTFPIGCFEEDGSIYFNKHWKGEVRSNVAPVCKQGRITGQFVTGFSGSMDVLGETLTVAECQDAASMLVLTFKGETNRDDLPPGCSWLLHLSRVWFNEHPTGKANKDAARVFKLDAATPSIPQDLWDRIAAASRR